ncbi:hypothetical protein TNCV_2294131 [Trichonephila clavipes]|nr:hypothetical protein TNCV_2294131 [Trichonephila clavipes]
MVSLGHPSFPPTDLGQQDDEEVFPGGRPLQLDIFLKLRCPLPIVFVRYNTENFECKPANVYELHWRAKIKNEVEKLAYQLNEEAERTERPIRILSKEQLSGDSIVVVHDEPHPQMTGTLSYRQEETGGRQREKSLDTRHRRLDDRYRVLPWQKTARWWSVCTTPCLVCTFNACPSEKAFSVVPETPELERQ